MTPGERQRVVDFADTHGPTAASRRFQVPKGTVTSWQHRTRQAEARHQRWLELARQGEAEARAEREPAAEPEPRLVADPNPSEAELAYRMAHNICLRCGGVGWVAIPEVCQGTLLLRRGRRQRCQDCGGLPRIVQVVEHPPASWVQGMIAAGNLGAGWTPELWAMIRRGEPNPLGYRVTGPPD